MGRPKGFDPDVAVDRAMEVFWRKGYARTTPQDLVEALGLGKGSLYNAFGSKRALFELALRRYRDSQVMALIEMLEAAGPVKERLRRALTSLVVMDLADPDRRGCLAVNSAAELAGAEDAAAVDLVRRMFDRTEGAFRSLIAEGQRSGEVAPERDPAALAALLLNTVVGLRLTMRLTQDSHRPAQVVDAVIDSL
ncbi:TetR/AcrR family transcriptional regulator [Streptomyces sp. T12]|uniref:TetR/AcrR family transcriptional regulator n=1 Tax=Streptomyces sp. T12 TaxID=477697 RepID=UPI0011A03B50|nr:TetR/AcrR family transcriptional regulator [Streptomyces sp. T12]